MTGHNSATPPAEAWAHARDPRFNAPPTIASVHGDARTRILAARAEQDRRRFMQTYEQRAVEPTRQRDRLANAIVYGTVVAAGMLVLWMLARIVIAGVL